MVCCWCAAAVGVLLLLVLVCWCAFGVGVLLLLLLLLVAVVGNLF